MEHELVRSDDEIGSELDAAQAEYLRATEAVTRRQVAVKAAIDAGWTPYRIAKRFGVHARTVDAIVASIERRASSTPTSNGDQP